MRCLYLLNKLSNNDCHSCQAPSAIVFLSLVLTHETSSLPATVCHQPVHPEQLVKISVEGILRCLQFSSHLVSQYNVSKKIELPCHKNLNHELFLQWCSGFAPKNKLLHSNIIKSRQCGAHSGLPQQCQQRKFYGVFALKIVSAIHWIMCQWLCSTLLHSDMIKTTVLLSLHNITKPLVHQTNTHMYTAT